MLKSATKKERKKNERERDRERQREREESFPYITWIKMKNNIDPDYPSQTHFDN